MMKALAHFLLAVELFFSHPGKWWAGRGLFAKLFVVVAAVLSMNAATIWVYQQLSGPQPSEAGLSRPDRLEISSLKQQVAQLKEQQEALLKRAASEKQDPAAQALADEIGVGQTGFGGSQPEEDEPPRLEATSAARIVFLSPRQGETTPLYKKPEKSSAEVAAIPTGTWYLVVDRRTGWYQIEVDEDGRIGWVPSSVAEEQNLE